MSERAVLVKRYLISGRVQGVSYRYFTKRLADRIGVVGWVKNLPDGRVEAVAAGSVDELVTLRKGLDEGPVGSRVDKVEEVQLTSQPEWNRFDITF